jgi:hypothetical protein
VWEEGSILVQAGAGPRLAIIVCICCTCRLCWLPATHHWVARDAPPVRVKVSAMRAVLLCVV